MGKYIRVYLTIPQRDALVTAATAMLAGQQGQGDFLCNSDVLQRALDALYPPRPADHKQEATK